MKKTKLHYLAIPILLIFAGCTKQSDLRCDKTPELEQERLLDEVTDDLDQTYAFQEAVTVYDQTRRYWVSYLIYSNDPEAVESAVTVMKSSKIELSTEKDIASTDRKSVPKNTTDNGLMDFYEDLEKGIVIVETDRFTDTYNRYKLVQIADGSRIQMLHYTTMTLYIEGVGFMVTDKYAGAYSTYFHFVRYHGHRTYVLEDIASLTGLYGTEVFLTPGGASLLNKLTVVPGGNHVPGSPHIFDYTVITYPW